MVRLTDSGAIFGPGVRDRALLAGIRRRSDKWFVAAAARVGEATPIENYDNGETSVGSTAGAFAYDLTAHAASRVAGLELALSGVAGPRSRSYVALTLGLDVGWFGP